ncbi:MAG: greA [Marmoricola sp.]|nr:greA [Marmoricola sp.]MCW2828908.1 greA [Marmoricola sp.]
MTEPTQGDVVWLTQAKFDELQAELERLRGPGRAEIVKKVSEARDEGDLKENSGYHAAREELGKVDGRVQQLVDMLRRAKVGETPADDGVVEPGMKVTVKLLGADLTQEFLFGAREMAGDDITVYSPQSPLGQAIQGARRGDTVTYTLPNGKDQKAEILEAVPYTG